MHEKPLKKNEIFFDSEALLPGRNGEIISKIGAVLKREDFEQMKSQYYELRGWDIASGLPTKERLARLQLADVADDLAGRGLLK
jgi:aldehyde:ferredoxin oxidoreductase